MNEFIVVKSMNEAMQRLLKENGESTKINDEIEELLNDESIFYKISKQNAFNLLFSVGIIKSELENVYKKLVCPAMYYKLIGENKLNPNDKTIKIKFN